jgi:hypothetical protein
MGQERECRARLQSRTLSGRAYLETDHILIRGEERLKIPIKDLTAVTADGGVLRLEFGGGPLEIELGDAAVKWANKILHPPSRSAKLGIKRGLTVRLEGEFEPAFLDDLRGTEPAAAAAKADLVFYAARNTADLVRIPKLAAGIKPDGAIWVVYPKGVAVIRELDVLAAGREAGLKDIKVASFSATHTALRFVIPVASRTPTAKK